MMDAGRDFERIRDYIVGRLADDERRLFEDRLTREPQLVRDFEHSLRLREGLQALRAQGYVAAGARRARGLRIWLPALAAAALAAVAVFLWVQSRIEPPGVLTASLESRPAARLAPAVTARFTFVSVRGDSMPDLSLPARGLIEFRAAPPLRTASAYRVTLLRAAAAGPATPLGTLTDLALSADGYLHCYADAALLQPGRYVLRVAADGGSAATAEAFPFNLRARASP